MPRDPETGMVEPDIIVNGHVLSFAECITMRVAITSFAMWLDDPANRVGLGEQLATNYDHHAAMIIRTMLHG